MRLKCEQPFSMIKILMNGDIYMCPQGQPANINAYTTDPLEIWNSQRFIEIRKQLDTEQYDPMCMRCPLVQDFSQSAAEDAPRKISSELEKEYLALRLKNDQIYNAEGIQIPSNARFSIGAVDIAHKTKEKIEIQGWAADIKSNKPAKLVIVFNGETGLPIKATIPYIERDDVQQFIGINDLNRTGYIINFQLKKEESENITLRIFAMSHNGILNELNYYRDFPFVSHLGKNNIKKRIQNIINHLIFKFNRLVTKFKNLTLLSRA
ncbi:MAG: SPASM domain-containing protein [Bacteriovoracaceae bacterium]